MPPPAARIGKKHTGGLWISGVGAVAAGAALGASSAIAVMRMWSKPPPAAALAPAAALEPAPAPARVYIHTRPYTFIPMQVIAYREIYHILARILPLLETLWHQVRYYKETLPYAESNYDGDEYPKSLSECIEKYDAAPSIDGNEMFNVVSLIQGELNAFSGTDDYSDTTVRAFKTTLDDVAQVLRIVIALCRRDSGKARVVTSLITFQKEFQSVYVEIENTWLGDSLQPPVDAAGRHVSSLYEPTMEEARLMLDAEPA